ncbi:hypothetical protein JOD27_008670 [Lentzea nigeriaca]|nr:hypothetical protein [Lentzea nigeriaca]
MRGKPFHVVLREHARRADYGCGGEQGLGWMLLRYDNGVKLRAFPTPPATPPAMNVDAVVRTNHSAHVDLHVTPGGPGRVRWLHRANRTAVRV